MTPMPPTLRVNVNQTYDVYMGRASARYPVAPWGNPFRIEDVGSREKALELYEAHMRTRLATEPKLCHDIMSLRGKRLACHCKRHEACHVDIIIKLIRELRDVSAD